MFISFVLLFLPFLFGTIFGKNRGLCDQYVKGAMFELALFGLLYYIILFIVRSNSLEALTSIYNISLVLLVPVCIYRIYMQRLCIVQRVREVTVGIKREAVLMSLTLILLCYQILRIVVGMPTQVRDSAVYDPLVLDMVDSGLIYGPGGTNVSDVSQLLTIYAKYITTPWYVYEAYLSKISGLHALLITKTWIPLYILLISFMTLWVLGQELFRGEDSLRKPLLFVLMCSILYEARIPLGEQSDYLLIWPSWGKSVAASISCVLIFSLFVRIMESEGGKTEILWLFITSFAGTMTTAATIVVFPVELAALAIAWTYSEKKIYPSFVAILGMIPSLLQFVIYILYTKGYMTNWFMGTNIW